MKKVLAAALLCAVSAFATWDYFPVKDAGKGEAKLGLAYGMQGDWSTFGLSAQARFSVIEGLEVALFTAFPMTVSYDGESCDSDFMDCPPSMAKPVIGLRYWLPMGLGIGLDVDLPFQGDYYGGGDAANLVFTPAIQYSTKLGAELELGSQINFSIPLENTNKMAPPMELGIGLELDYSIGSVTPFVGVDVAIELTGPSYDGETDDDYKTATGIMPYVGVIYKINDMFVVDASVAFGIGEDYFGEDMPISIGASFAINF